jgi:hypothetical protein
MENGVITLALVRFADGWRLVTAKRTWGRFDFLVDAEEAALRVSARMTQDGRAVQMLRQGRAGELEHWAVY